jgi:hypothetical protein
VNCGVKAYSNDRSSSSSRTTRESRTTGGMKTRYRDPPTTLAVRARSRVSIRKPRRLMACLLPLRPWHSPGLGVFGSRTTWGQSTDPAQVLSCACAPPQWLAPSLVVPQWGRGRPCLLCGTPRIGPRPFSISGSKDPFVRPACDRAFERPCLAVRRPRLQGLATLLAVSALPSSGACFSSQRSWASLFRAFFRYRG